MLRCAPTCVAVPLLLLVASCSPDATGPRDIESRPVANEVPLAANDLGFAIGSTVVPQPSTPWRAPSSPPFSTYGVVLPNAYTTIMGEQNNTYPFWPNMRYQQVFLGSELEGQNSIGRICFRKDDEYGGPAETMPLTIKLGPTDLDFTNLGSEFDANYSAPSTIVFDGDLEIPESSGGGTPDAFYFCVPLTLVYHPPVGKNVIVEIISWSQGAPLGHFNDFCWLEEACTTARAYTYASATAPTADEVESNSGLIMKFLGKAPFDCMNGGWEQQGFGSLGECIRFLQTGVDRR